MPLHSLHGNVEDSLTALSFFLDYFDVLRELLHNSLDARATSFLAKVHLDSWTIMVTDNGCGISTADMELVGRKNYTSRFCSHKTAKKTLGSRGTALFALSQVSRSLIVSQSKGGQPTQKHLGSAKVTDFHPVSHGPKDQFAIEPPDSDSWTVVVVRDLFSGLRVRRAALEATCYRDIHYQVRNLVAECLLLCPNISLGVQFVPETSLAPLTLSRPLGDPIVSTIQSLYGFQLLPACEAVDVKYQNNKICGVISRHSASNPVVFWFINGVRFIPPRETSTLLAQSSVLFMSTADSEDATPVSAAAQWHKLKPMVTALLAKFELVSPRSSPRRKRLAKSPRKSPISSPASSFSIPRTLNFDSIRVLRQLDCKFILFVATDGADQRLYVADQHACDERIRVETYLKGFVAATRTRQLDNTTQLQPPVPLALTQAQTHQLESMALQLNEYGFEFASSPQGFLVTQVPCALYDTSSASLTAGLLRYLQDIAAKNRSSRTAEPHDWTHAVKDLPQFVTDCINTRACRSAVMFGTPLSLTRMEQMLKSLGKCRNPFRCAHGRPSVVLVDASIHPLWDRCLRATTCC